MIAMAWFTTAQLSGWTGNILKIYMSTRVCVCEIYTFKTWTNEMAARIFVLVPEHILSWWFHESSTCRHYDNYANESQRQFHQQLHCV